MQSKALYEFRKAIVVCPLLSIIYRGYAMQLGVSGCLGKPRQEEELLRQIARLCSCAIKPERLDLAGNTRT